MSADQTAEYGIKALSWKEVDEIVAEFEKLNPYDPKKVPGSLLKIEDQNYDKDGKPVQLYAQCISAKRYVEWVYDKHDNIQIVEAKAHALGVLKAPKAKEDGDFIEEAWHEIIEGFGYAAPRPRPEWYDYIAKMQIANTTPAVCGMLKGFVPPFNFVDMPLAFPVYDKKGVQIKGPTLIMQYSKNPEATDGGTAFDTRTGKKWNLYAGINTKGIHKRGEIWVKTYGSFLAEYRSHPEAKFVDREGNPCSTTTRGLLRPAHIIEDQRRYIGKETSRKWEQGADISLLEEFATTEYRSNGKVIANAATIERIKAFGIRKLEKVTEIHRETLILICKGKPVKPSTLRQVIQFLDTEEKRQIEERDPFHEDTPDILPDLKEHLQMMRHDLIKNFGPPELIETAIIFDQRIRRLVKLQQESAI